ncbi:MAG TPA: hypothetical protein VFT57_04610 [Gemmatimonadaceae bacterium]|nr:hypothetical protein [Gemmatimonadaceae bacterium]
MRVRFVYLAATAALLWSRPSFGQSPDLLSRILSAAKLPVSTAQAREEGTPSDVIRKVLEVMMGARVPAGEAHDVIDEERAARRENGPVDNFGAFVQSQLAAGLRGRELAAAIRAEHAARGKGHGSAAGKGHAASGAGNPHGNQSHGGQGRGNADASGAGKGRGGAPAARSAHDSSRARGASEGARGAPGKGKRPEHPSHPNR